VTSENGEQPVRTVVQRGLWFEEFDTGVRYLHRPGRTITEADNVLFTTLTMNTKRCIWMPRSPTRCHPSISGW
jgi:acyl dehydratase